MILLTKADDKEVVVFVDQKKSDLAPLTVRHKSGLNLFRRGICLPSSSSLALVDQ